MSLTKQEHDKYQIINQFTHSANSEHNFWEGKIERITIYFL